MANISGFDFNLGIHGLTDGRVEIGRANLPGPARLIPESHADRSFALVYGKLTDSGLLERFAPYFALDLKHRELLSPDVFFEALEGAADSCRRDSGGGENGEPGEGPLAETARALAAVLADRELCEMLRNLVLKA